MTIDFENICRLCMMPTKSMIALFDDISALPSKIMMLIPTLKIFAGDKLPKQVCEECVNQINNFDRFKLKCENSQLTLNKCLHNLQLGNEMVENCESWRLSTQVTASDSSTHSKKVYRNKHVENNYRKEELQENKCSEVKLEDDGEECEYDTMKAEPEIEVTIANETHITNDTSMNETIMKPFSLPCHICGKMVVRRRLTNHIKRHTIGRPYKCGDCGKMYIDRSSLKTHSVVHSGLKVHMCDICGKRFKLLTHLKNHHLTHTGQKSYVCDVCGKRFSQIGNLKKHEIIHTGEKPFSCDICGKSFTEKNTLQIHLAAHAGQKQHVCKICGKGFLMKGHLTNHFVVHSGEKRFTCDICGNRYAQRHSLKKHKAKHGIHR